MTIPYTQSEKDFIANNLHLTNAELAEAIGRSKSAVSTYKNNNGLFKNIEVIPWQDYEKVLSLYFRLNENSVSAIAHITGFKKYKVDKIINEYLDKSMGILEQEGAANILFEYNGEKQYWRGLVSTVEREHPGCHVISVKPVTEK